MIWRPEYKYLEFKYIFQFPEVKLAFASTDLEAEAGLFFAFRDWGQLKKVATDDQLNASERLSGPSH